MSDLREALEKLATELEYDVAGAPGKIRALLAAHPAEPGLAFVSPEQAKRLAWYASDRAAVDAALRPTQAEIEEVLGDHAEDNVIDCVCGWRDDEHNDDGDHLRHQAKELHRFITEYGKVATPAWSGTWSDGSPVDPAELDAQVDHEDSR